MVIDNLETVVDNQLIFGWTSLASQSTGWLGTLGLYVVRIKVLSVLGEVGNRFVSLLIAATEVEI